MDEDYLLSVTYEKMVIYEDGTYEFTDYPPCCFVGLDYLWTPYDRKCALAWCRNPAGLRVNEWYERIKRRGKCKLYGPIVLFRHYGAVTFADYARLPCFFDRNFSSLSKEKTSIWQKQSQPSPWQPRSRQ